MMEKHRRNVSVGMNEVERATDRHLESKLEKLLICIENATVRVGLRKHPSALNQEKVTGTPVSHFLAS